MMKLDENRDDDDDYFSLEMEHPPQTPAFSFFKLLYFVWKHSK